MYNVFVVLKSSLVRLRGACRMAYIPGLALLSRAFIIRAGQAKNIWSAPTTHNHIWPRLSAVDGSRYDGSRTIYPSLKSVARAAGCACSLALDMFFGNVLILFRFSSSLIYSRCA